MNRESWLSMATDSLVKPLLSEAAAKTDYKWRVSVGWAKGKRGGRGETVGQCWSPNNSSDRTHEIFISPKLGDFEAVSTLLHEHIHASVGLKEGHKGEFARVAKAIGFVGKMTQTPCGPELKERIEAYLKAAPKYPHAEMKVDPNAPKPGSRLVKCKCGECGYTVRTTAKWIALAIPRCPIDRIEMGVQS